MWRLALLTAFAIAVSLLDATAAPAAPNRGAVTIDLRGGALRTLDADGATITARAPARIRQRTLRLPVRAGVVGPTAYINLGGTLRLRHEKRTLTITRLQARLGSTTRIAGTIRGRRITLLTGARKPSLNATTGTASVRNAQLTLTRTAARTIKRALRLRRLPAGAFGRATVDALVSATTTGTANGNQPNPGPGGGSTDPMPIVTPPPGTPDELAPLARPATAIDVTSATVTWHVRDSWIRYINTGSGSSPLGAAVAGSAIAPEQHPCPDSPASAPALVYSYTLALTGGWHDAASGQTALKTSGGVRFLYPSHGIDLEVHDLEVELNGAASRVIARFDGRLSTTPGNKRAVLVNLAPTALTPAATATVRGKLPANGSTAVFAGFYPPEAGFGCMTVSFTT